MKTVYTRDELVDAPRGQYLFLFNISGLDGPYIGPLDWVHVAYFETLRIKFASEALANCFIVQEGMSAHDHDGDGVVWLAVKDNRVVFDGKYYDDWSVDLIK